MPGLFDDSEESLKDLSGRNRDRNARRSRDNSSAVREIGPLPEVADPARRKSGLGSLEFFLPTYFPHTFTLDFAPIHQRAITKIEETARDGGLYAFAMPRGTGKTTIVEGAAIWCILNGYRRFLQIIGATAEKSKDILRSIKTELETNELLLDDFPEVCYPVAMLEGINGRAPGQTLDGERTRISWTDQKIVLPTVAGSKCSGSIIRVAGITGSIRGAKHKTAGGETLRPDFVLADDPQTMQSAASDSQNERRLRILAQDVLGLAGPDKKIAGIVPCTVIFPGDMVDQILDRKRHPRWNGERTKLLDAFPKDMDIWEQYGKIRDDGFRAEDGGLAANRFYEANREAMDKGASVTWNERYNEDQLSAIQYAMDLYLDDPEGFAAEYQNEPNKPKSSIDLLSREELAGRLNNLPHLVSPTSARRITCKIDVQGKCLYYCLIAWSEHFTGAIIDYGAWPRQKREYYTFRELTNTLARLAKTRHPETQIAKGLETLTTWLLDEREYFREDGSPIQIEKVMIDKSYATETVDGWIYRNSRKGLIVPFRGQFIGPDAKPLGEYRKEPGDISGDNWRIPKAKEKGTSRHCLVDVNHWKKFLHNRLSTAPLAPGSLTLWGHEPRIHRMIADHLRAETPRRVKGRFREIDIFEHLPPKSDNHLLDCVSGCCVGESILGGRIEVATPATKRKKARRKRRASTLKC